MSIVILRPVWMTNHPPSVLWHSWLGHQTCKNRRSYNLYCVGADVKPCSVNQSILTFDWQVLHDVQYWITFVDTRQRIVLFDLCCRFFRFFWSDISVMYSQCAICYQVSFVVVTRSELEYPDCCVIKYRSMFILISGVTLRVHCHKAFYAYDVMIMY